MELNSGKPRPRHRSTEEERLLRPPLEDRVSRLAADLQDQASRLPPGAEREQLLRRARQLVVNNDINAWLTSPGLQRPK
jgi:hypothetical protein